MKKETKEKMDFWLSQYPGSTHPLDEKRLFNFVKELCLNDEDVRYEDLFESFRRNHPDYDEKYSEKFCEKWDLKISLLKRFGTFLLENK